MSNKHTIKALEDLVKTEYMAVAALDSALEEADDSRVRKNFKKWRDSSHEAGRRPQRSAWKSSVATPSNTRMPLAAKCRATMGPHHRHARRWQYRRYACRRRAWYQALH